MKFFKSLGASSLICGLLVVPVFGQRADRVPSQSRPVDVPVSAVIEAIEFDGVAPELQKTALERIGLRVGDRLTSEARQRIGRELTKMQKGMTFTYRIGRTSGSAKLIISADC